MDSEVYNRQTTSYSFKQSTSTSALLALCSSLHLQNKRKQETKSSAPFRLLSGICINLISSPLRRSPLQTHHPYPPSLPHFTPTNSKHDPLIFPLSPPVQILYTSLPSSLLALVYAYCVVTHPIFLSAYHKFIMTVFSPQFIKTPLRPKQHSPFLFPDTYSKT